MSRSKNREEAFKLLYSLQINMDSDRKEQIELFFNQEKIINKDCKEYIQSVITGIEENNAEIEKQISENIKEGWSIERISKIDIALLKLGIFEIIYSKLPYKVVINEVVELSKKYGDDNSKSFVNGVLASIVKKNNIT